MDVDTEPRKTEGDWARSFDAFSLKVVPLWFDWLGWLLVLAAIRYLAETTGSRVINLLYLVSFAGLFNYSIAILTPPAGILRAYRHRRWLVNLVILVSFSVVIGIWFLLRHLIAQVQAMM